MAKNVDTNQKAIDKLNRTTPQSSTPLTTGASLQVQQQSGPANQAVNGVPAAKEDPGRTMGILSFALSLAGIFMWVLTAIPGMILGIVGYFTSKRAGFTNGYAIAGAIIGSIITIGSIIVLALIFTSEDFRESLDDEPDYRFEIQEDSYWDYTPGEI